MAFETHREYFQARKDYRDWLKSNPRLSEGPMMEDPREMAGGRFSRRTRTPDPSRRWYNAYNDPRVGALQRRQAREDMMSQSYADMTERRRMLQLLPELGLLR